MNTYMKKSPIYYAIFIQGFKDKNGWHLTNEDEIDEFAKKFNMDWHWNMKKGVLDFEDIGFFHFNLQGTYKEGDMK